MRVLHVVEVDSGGVVTYVQALAAAQVAAGLDVHVLAPVGVQVPDVTLHRWRPQRRSPWRFPAAVGRLGRVTEEVTPDVVHLHSFFAGVLGRLRRLPAPVVYQPHSWAFEAVPAPGRAAVAAWERHARSRTACVVVNCDDELAEAARHGVEVEGRSVGVPLDLERFRPGDDDERRALRAERGIGATEQLHVCVARLSRQKGQDQLSAAWESAARPEGRLVFVGAGDWEPLQQQAPTTWGRSQVAVGATDDVRGWLVAADVVVMPSRYEGQSVAMAEAMACGRPVVSTDVNGVQQALVEGQEPSAGAIVPLGDMTALLEQCAKLLDDPCAVETAGRAARSRAERLFSATEVERRVVAVYEQVLTAAPQQEETAR